MALRLRALKAFIVEDINWVLVCEWLEERNYGRAMNEQLTASVLKFGRKGATGIFIFFGGRG